MLELWYFTWVLLMARPIFFTLRPWPWSLTYLSTFLTFLTFERVLQLWYSIFLIVIFTVYLRKYIMRWQNRVILWMRPCKLRSRIMNIRYGTIKIPPGSMTIDLPAMVTSLLCTSEIFLIEAKRIYTIDLSINFTVGEENTDLII